MSRREKAMLGGFLVAFGIGVYAAATNDTGGGWLVAAAVVALIAVAILTD